MSLCAEDAAVAVSSNSQGTADGVVLLKDGGVLEGRITQATDRYIITRTGGEFQIAADRVAFVGRSLHDAYEYRRASTQDSPEAHVALAEWCLRYNSIDDARTEIERARSLDADPRRLELAERRLAATQDRLAKKPASSSGVIQASAIVEQAPAAAVTPDLPHYALETFTRKVQPILVNNCTTSKCHQPGGQQAFQLNRASLRGEANRRTTMQNLSAALALVDRDHPEQSQLLTLPRQTHGGMNGPTFGPRQDQAFKHLADWVALLAPPKIPLDDAATSDATAAEPAALPPSNSAATMPTPKPIEPTSHVDATRSQRDPAKAAIDNAETKASLESLRTPHRLRYGASVDRWEPRDPFDPEIFNRRQRVRAQAQTRAVGPVPSTIRQASGTADAQPPGDSRSGR
jgi:hypothetical protein